MRNRPFTTPTRCKGCGEKLPAGVHVVALCAECSAEMAARSRRKTVTGRVGDTTYRAHFDGEPTPEERAALEKVVEEVAKLPQLQEPPQVDLDELAEWCRHHYTGQAPITPADLQRVFHLTFNRACSALEALEARGDLQRIDHTRLHWRPARKPTEPQESHLRLTGEERALLAELIDWRAAHPAHLGARNASMLRTIRDRLRRNS